MATTIVPSDLIVTISESYTVNGVNYGNSLSKTFTQNGQVSQRVMAIDGKGGSSNEWTGIINLGTEDDAGQVVKADFKYFRVTNLDTVNSLHLRIYNAADYVMFEILPASTQLFMDGSFDSTTTSVAVTFADITAISGQSSHQTEDVDIEFVMVTT
tara:strand:- start:208 stop:675 length:468 start_codon:yes stop_codon:yes gene_type:complete